MCKIKINLQAKERAAAIKDAGGCSHCHKFKRLKPGTKLCFECAEKLRLQYIEVYANKKGSGLCTACQESPPRQGKTQCEACAEKQAVAKAARRIVRKESGLCVYCGKNAAELGRYGCRHCLDIQNPWKKEKRGSS